MYPGLDKAKISERVARSQPKFIIKIRVGSLLPTKILQRAVPPPDLAEVSISRGQPPPALDSAGGTWPAEFFKLKLWQKARQRQSIKLSPKEQCRHFKKMSPQYLKEFKCFT